ncbi:sulfotransferase family protein [Janthinobacterium sp. BJB426]|uniref:sulfotransferase family protein n=1 Tax=Janthinobacterium sp. BJB426 TaxID=2048010 RepID=UPI000C0FED2F|nr:sulfotransferase family protein [Janthinobacterium sp. BJB426]PHV27642.1 sulfotransferase family protein [Janthinobacterium sp. BJB426]
MSAAPGLAQQERLLARGETVTWHEGMDLRGWYPLYVERGETLADATMCWRHLGKTPFNDAFFVNTLARQPHEERRVCRTPLAALAMVATLGDGLAPDAFIFHVSRCGSTLLSQLLASLPQCIVMSEPPVIDSLLRLHHDGMAGSDSIALLRQAILALGRRRSGDETHFLIKFDCWHIHSLDLLRQAFPGTPCLFVYREPLAVLASHQRQRGPQMVPGMLHPAQLPLPAHLLTPGDIDGYTGLVLASLFDAALPHAAAGQLQLINYKQLPDIVFSDLLARFGITSTAAQLQAMHAQGGVHAKYGTAYHGDPPVPATDGLAAIAAQLQPGYLALEALRLPAGQGQ